MRQLQAEPPHPRGRQELPGLLEPDVIAALLIAGASLFDPTAALAGATSGAAAAAAVVPGPVIVAAPVEVTPAPPPVSEGAYPQILDRTAEALPLLLTTFTDAEIAGAGTFTIVWDDERSHVSLNGEFEPECFGVYRCILLDIGWWTNSGWKDQLNANRVLAAHEFAHVLSLERKEELDAPYILAVNRVDEECLADAVATLVLARGGHRPSVTDDYNVAYQCGPWWIDTFGEDRSAEAAALAADLLDWAAHRFDPPPIVEPAPIDTPATATVGAVRQAP